jgi:hypothetical protein
MRGTATHRWTRPLVRWRRLSWRHRGWAVQNWLQGYKLGAVSRFRCCDHTTPTHYRWCAEHPDQGDSKASS